MVKVADVFCLQLVNSSELRTSLALTSMSLALYEWLGAIVSSKLSATHRVCINSLTPVLLYTVAMYEGWGTFDAVKVCGLVIIITGCAVYTKVRYSRIAHTRMRYLFGTIITGGAVYIKVKCSRIAHTRMRYIVCDHHYELRCVQQDETGQEIAYAHTCGLLCELFNLSSPVALCTPW